MASAGKCRCSGPSCQSGKLVPEITEIPRTLLLLERHVLKFRRVRVEKRAVNADNFGVATEERMVSVN